MKSGPVVVGTDLSQSATEAVAQAARWAARTSAPMLVVQVAPDQIFRNLEVPRVVAALTERIGEVTSPLGVSLEVVVDTGSAHGALIRRADERGASLLVVGASGVTRLDRVFFGTTAEQVVRHAHCSVLVARPSPGGPILAATDFSDRARAGVDAAAEEARRCASPLVLIHSLYEPASSLALLGPLVISPPEIPEAERAEIREAALTTLRTLAEAAGYPESTALVDGPPVASIVEEAKRLEASLLVVATHGRTGLERMALGSVAEGLARFAPCSVLAARRTR